MSDQRVYNFSAGPSMLPLSALERAGSEITNYRGSGMSVMEMSHRSKVFIQIFEETQEKLRRIMNVPQGYKILFLQTGASGQFSMIPLNLIGKTGKADYAVTGNFSNLAYKEAQKYGQIHLAASSEDRDHSYIPAQSQLKLDPEASYFYYCANNTIYAPSGNMSLTPAACPWCVICPPTSCPCRWMYPNSALSMLGHRKTWPLPASLWSSSRRS